MKDKTKYYSKETFKQEKNIELTVVLICAFLIRIYSRIYMYEQCNRRKTRDKYSRK